MAFSIKYVYHAVDKFSAVSDKIGRSVDKLKDKMNHLGDKAEKVGKKMKDVGKELSTKVTLPLAAVGLFALRSASSIETMNTSFESMLRSEEKAKKMTEDLLKFAAKTPFEMEGIGGATKQLLSFGVQQEDIISKLQFLGDIAAGANVPLSDMAAIFGKAKAKGKAMTEELLQLSDRGVPIIDVLAKQLGVSSEKIFKMASQGKISFDILEKAMQSMTTGSGIFANQMIKQSRTLAGVFSTFKDSLFMASAALGSAIVDAYGLRDGVVSLSSKVEELTAWFQGLSPTTRNLIVYVGTFIAVLGPLIVTLGILTAAVAQLGWVLAIATSPITWIIVAIGLLVASFVIAYRKFEWFQKGVDTMCSLIVKAFNGLVAIFKFFWDIWKSGFKSIWEYATQFAQKIIGVYSRIKSFFGLGDSDREFNINVNHNKNLAADDVNISSRSNVDINLRDPGSNVSSVKSKTSGPTSLNVGYNMAGAN